MKILISGSSGLVGQAVVNSLQHRGDQVFRLLRSPAFQTRSTDVVWDDATGKIDLTKIEGMDVVIHLAGDSIASGRWTSEKKERIRKSRVEPTRHLAEALNALSRPPKLLITASAIGYYGDRPKEILDEKSAPGTGFLTDVCQAWEEAARTVSKKGIRVVTLRFGVILSPDGGALAKMLLPFKLGVGGPLGDGSQYMSWIDLGDVVDIVRYAIRQENLEGVVNAVSPVPVTNKEFTKTLGRVLMRPTLLPAPRFALKLVVGEMAEALLLSSTRVMPQALLENGFRFRFPDLDTSLRHLLTR